LEIAQTFPDDQIENFFYDYSKTLVNEEWCVENEVAFNLIIYCHVKIGDQSKKDLLRVKYAEQMVAVRRHRERLQWGNINSDNLKWALYGSAAIGTVFLIFKFFDN